MKNLSSVKLAAVLAGGASVIAVAAAQPAQAQQTAQADQPAATSSGLEEIVVTARRREEKAQSVPIAISNVSAAKLEEQHILNTSDLTKEITGYNACCVPGQNLDASSSHVGGVFAQGYQWIRGVPGVISYWDNVPTVGSAGLLFDIDTVQLYKGPQGTLFGLATNGGAVQFTPKHASNIFEGYVEAEVGDYGHTRLDGILNVPIIDGVLDVRVGGRINRTDGYIYEMAHKTWLGNVNQDVGRLAITFRPTDDIQNDFVGNYLQFSDNPASTLGQIRHAGPLTNIIWGANPASLVTYGGPLGWYAVPGNANFGQAPYEQGYETNLVNTTTWDITDNVTLKNIVGYVELGVGTGYGNGTDSYVPLGAPPPNFTQATLATGPGIEGTEELQVLGKIFNDKLTFNAGTFLLFSEGTSAPYTINYSCTAPNSAASCSGGLSNAVERSNAVYAQGTYDLSDFLDGLSLTGGVRYTWDRVNGFTGAYLFPTGAVPSTCFGNNSACYWSAKEASSAPSYTMSLDWQIDPTTLVYVTNSKGYSRGGLNLTATLPAGPGRFFAPESLSQVEGGIKADWNLPFDMKARTNVAIFYDFYDNIQVSTNTPIVNAIGQATSAVVTQNAATGHIEGLDFDLTLIPVKGVTLSGGGVWLGRYYDDYPYCLAFTSGVCTSQTSFTAQTFDISSKWTWHISASYDLPIDESLGKATFTWNFSHIGPYIGTVGFPYTNPFDYVQSINLSDMSVSWSDFLGRPSLDARVYLTNVFGAHGGQGSVPVYSAIQIAGENVAPPRMWGVSLKYSFGSSGASESSSAAAYTAPVVQAPAPRPPAVPRSYLVFFDFDKSDLTSEARQIVDTAARNATGVTRIEVTGHTDTVGSDEYNMRLSHRRAMAVSAEMQARGIPESEIAIFAKGKRALLVPTGDGVREPQNRRVEIVYSGGPGA